MDSAGSVARGFLAQFNSIILYPLITLMMTVALIVFLWGCFQFIMNAGNDTARTQGKQHIMWGLVGMLIMVSAYAILSIAAGTIGCDLNNIEGCR